MPVIQPAKIGPHWGVILVELAIAQDTLNYDEYKALCEIIQQELNDQLILKKASVDNEVKAIWKREEQVFS